MTQCPVHANKEIIGTCGACEEFVCDRDGVELQGTLFCRRCVDSIGPGLVPARQRRSRRRGGKQPRQWRPFKKARAFARSLGLRSFDEWRRFAKGAWPEKGERPQDIPAQPHVVYAGEWQSCGDWLGTGRVAYQKRVCRPFAKARAFARGLGLRNGKEWEAFCRGEMPKRGRLPSDIPATPRVVYRSEWRGFSDFLGYRGRGGRYRSFVAARKFARALGLSGLSEWIRYVKKGLPGKEPLPPDVPSSPNKSYADKWQGYRDWLGTAPAAWVPFAKARSFVRGLGLRSTAEWRAYCRGDLEGKPPLPAGVPRTPQLVYAKKWAGIPDWLGMEKAFALVPIKATRLAAIVRWIRSQPGGRLSSAAIATRFWLRKGELGWVCERLREDHGALLLHGTVRRRRGTIVVLPPEAETRKSRSRRKRSQ